MLAPQLAPPHSPCDVVLVDSVGDQLVRLADLDAGGTYDGVHEVTALWRNPQPLTPRAVAFDELSDPPRVLWLDSADDLLLAAGDENGNGRLDGFETRVLRDSGALDGASRPLAIAVTDDGAVWWCSDQGFAGLFRCADGDGDGLLDGAQELVALVGGGSAVHPVETDAGPALVEAGSLVSLASDGVRVAAYAQGGDEALIAVLDGDGDGDALDPGESRLLLNASGKNPVLPQAAAFASGALPSLAVPGAGGAVVGYGRLSRLAHAWEGGASAWYAACDSHVFGGFATNASGEGLNGLVFRGVDANGDGDLQDAGEVRLFFDGSHTGATPVFDAIVDVAACGGELLVAYRSGPNVRVARLADRNGDGDAEDAGESDLYAFDGKAWSGVSPFAAAAPFVQGVGAVARGRIGEPNGTARVFGEGCAVTQSGLVPAISAVGRARIGSAGFSCELRGAQGGAGAILWVGDDSPGWYAFPLPHDLSVSGWPGCWQLVSFLLFRGAWTSGPPGAPGAGGAAVTFALPDEPELVGKRFRFQWALPDLHDHPYLGGLGLALTEACEVEIEP